MYLSKEVIHLKGNNSPMVSNLVKLQEDMVDNLVTINKLNLVSSHPTNNHNIKHIRGLTSLSQVNQERLHRDNMA